MSRPSCARITILLVFAVLSVLAACAADESREQLRGVVIEIESEGLGEVRSFTLKRLDETHKIYIDPDVTYDFPVSHLSAHRAAAEPVEVGVTRRNGRLFATTIADG